jgi:hypothetical protein
MKMIDLEDQIRNLIDGASPVSAREAMQWGSNVGTAARVSPIGRCSTLWIAGAAAAAVVVAGGTTLVVQARSTPRMPIAPAHAVVLSAKDVSDITSDSNAAMASTGVAQLTDETEQGGIEQSKAVGIVTFAGQNIDEDETVTSYLNVEKPESFGVDDREVDGQFYIYTPGPDDVTRWYHDTGSDGVQSMAFPDPRALYAQIQASADFEAVGTSTKNGETLTHLRAQDPAAISESSFASLTTGPLTSFDMWVDPAHVVQQLSFTSAQTQKACTLYIGSEQLKSTLHKANFKKLVTTTKGTGDILWKVELGGNSAGPKCALQTTSQDVTVTFSGLGGNETVVVPPNAVDFVAKG